MTTRQQLYAELENIKEENLDDFYQMLKDFIHTKQSVKKTGLLERLQQIKIDAPEDFTTHFDLYMNGSKDEKANLR
jgi:hypothetical protein